MKSAELGVLLRSQQSSRYESRAEATFLATPRSSESVQKAVLIIWPGGSSGRVTVRSSGLLRGICCLTSWRLDSDLLVNSVCDLRECDGWLLSLGNMTNESRPRRILIFSFLLVLHGCDLHDEMALQPPWGTPEKEATYLTGHKAPARSIIRGLCGTV